MQLFLAVKLFFLAQGGIFKRTFARGKRAAMAAMQQPLLMQQFQVLANGDLRCLELLGKFGHQDPAFALYQLDNRASAFFIHHKVFRSFLEPRPEFRGVVISISLYSVSFRLSSARYGIISK